MNQLAVTTETLLGVATPWMVVCVPGPGEPPEGAGAGSLDLAHPANRPAMAIRPAMPSNLTRNFLNVMCATFAARCSRRNRTGAQKSPCDLRKVGAAVGILSSAVCADSHTSGGNIAVPCRDRRFLTLNAKSLLIC
jgi:hypothetical protein